MALSQEVIARLQQEPRPEDIAYDRPQLYIPIGRVIEMLDEDFGPGSWEFVVDDAGLIPAGDRVYAHCRGALIVSGPDGITAFRAPGVGASTASGGKGVDESYPAALSFALKNAAKKLGLRYGRGLGRNPNAAQNGQGNRNAQRPPQNAAPPAQGGYGGNYPPADGPPPMNGGPVCGQCGNTRGVPGIAPDGSAYKICYNCLQESRGRQAQGAA